MRLLMTLVAANPLLRELHYRVNRQQGAMSVRSHDLLGAVVAEFYVLHNCLLPISHWTP